MRRMDKPKFRRRKELTKGLRRSFGMLLAWLDRRPGLATWGSAVVAMLAICYTAWQPEWQEVRQNRAAASAWCKDFSALVNRAGDAMVDAEVGELGAAASALRSAYDAGNKVRLDLLSREETEVFVKARGIGVGVTGIIAIAAAKGMESVIASSVGETFGHKIKGDAVLIFEAGNLIEGRHDLREGMEQHHAAYRRVLPR